MDFINSPKIVIIIFYQLLVCFDIIVSIHLCSESYISNSLQGELSLSFYKSPSTDIPLSESRPPTAMIVLPSKVKLEYLDRLI